MSVITQNTPDITQKINAARELSNRAYEDSIVKWHNFGEMFQAQVKEQGSRPYIIFRDGDKRTELSYKEMFDRCCRVADFMQNTLGIKEGERVGTVAYNHLDTVVVYYAAWLVGAVVIPFNAGDSDDRLTYSFNNGDVTAIFAMPDLCERVAGLKSQMPAVEHYVQINGENTAQDFVSMTDAEKYASPEYTYQNNASQETEALIVYTSGTTGNPKGVLLQQRQILVDSHCIADWYSLTPAKRALNVLPIHHVNGLIVTLVTPLYSGGSVVVNRKFSASGYWKCAAEEGVDWGSVVPTVLAFLCEAKGSEVGHDFSKFKFLICGAGPLTIETATRFENNFPVKVIHGYGLSESTCYSCYLPMDLPETERKEWLSAYGYPSIGVALPCNEMDIQTETGQSLQEDERGEIVIRGQNIMKEYFKRPDANAETFANNWFRSGDEGFYKTDNKGRKFFFITGRLKELIIRGGINYSPLEIDEVISRVPGVRAGMAVGFEHNMYGEEIGAYVQKEEGATITEADVIKGCASLPFTKRPKVVLFGEEFPVTATGKYQRLKLKPLFEKWKDVQFRE